MLRLKTCPETRKRPWPRLLTASDKFFFWYYSGFTSEIQGQVGTAAFYVQGKRMLHWLVKDKPQTIGVKCFSVLLCSGSLSKSLPKIMVPLTIRTGSWSE